MANENLIFRKGLQAKLAALPIKPGAISITIDEPGMYIDLPANADLGHNDNYRVRIGDVITVQTLGELADLKNLTPANLSDDGGKTSLQGRINEYSSSALYYVTGQNMLLKYNVATGKFIWINDTTSLQEQIASLGVTVADHSTRLGNVEKAIGDADDAKTEATVYGAIAKVRADLGDQIAGILGGGDGVTLDSLDAAIKAEAQAREAADKTINEKLTPLANLVGETNDTAEDATVFGYIAAEKARAEGVESEHNTRIKALEDLKTADTYATKAALKELSDTVDDHAESITTLTNNLNQNYYQKGETYSKDALDAQFSAITAAETGLIAVAEAAAKKHATDLDTEVRKDFAKADTEIEAKITTINQQLSTYATTEALDSAVNTLNGNIATEKQNAINAATSAAESYTDAQLKAFEEGEYTDHKNDINSKITTLTSNKADASTVYTKNEIDGKVNTINQAIANQKTELQTYADTAEADAKSYTDAEIKKVDTKLTTLTGSAETKTDAAAKLAEAKTYAEQKASAAQTAAENTAKGYADTLDAKVREDFAAEDLKLSQSISSIVNNTIPTLATKADTYTKSEVDGLIDGAKDYADEAVADVLRAAEAMRFKGTLTSAEPLEEAIAKTDVEAGDVWVVATISVDGTYKPGDMLIAKNDNADAVEKWTHVKTGYDSSLEQMFFTEVNADANGGKISLDSVGTLDTGSIEIKADLNSAVRVTMTKDSDASGNHGVATIGMVWEDF